MCKWGRDGTSWFAQLRLLLWKNWQLKKRRAGASCCELLFPVAAVFILLLIRSVVKIDDVQVAIPVGDKVKASADVPMLFRSMVCGQMYDATSTSDPASIITRYGYQSLAIVAGPNMPNGAKNEDVQALATLVGSILTETATNSGFLVYPPCCWGCDSNSTVTEVQDYATNPARNMVRVFDSDAALNNYIQQSDYGWHNNVQTISLAAVIDRAPGSENQWTYTLRSNSTDVPWTSRIIDPLATGYVHDPFFMYYSNHVLTFQWIIENYFINKAKEAKVSNVESQAKLVADEVFGAGTAGNKASAAAPVSSLTSSWPELSYLSLPVPAHRQDNFKNYVAQVLGLFLVIAFMWPFSRMVRNMVEEKEKKLAEGMKMMGLRNSAFWMSWVVTYLVGFTLVCILVIVVSKGSLFKYSDGGLLFWFFFSFCLSLISLACLVTTFFSRAKTAGTLSPFVLLAGYLPYFGVSDPTKSLGAKGAACIFSPVALSLGANGIVSFEGVFIGMQWNNLGDQVDNFQIQTAIAMMMFDAALYGVLAWYLDKVWPREYGTHEKWYFLFTPKYWRECFAGLTACCSRKGRSERQAIREEVFAGDLDSSAPTPRRMSVRGAVNHSSSNASSGTNTPARRFLKGSSSSYGGASLSTPLMGPPPLSGVDAWEPEPEPDFGPDYEPVPDNMRDKIGVKVRGLRKQFSRDGHEVVAVDGLDLNLYSGQCFVLLGHNGAGKTTTISMLTGLIETSAGSASLFDHDLNTEMSSIRQFMGVCPQHDVLFDDLTVYEHLEFFGKLKGILLKDLHQTVMTAIDEVQLKPKINTKSAALSGGQKRRLSLAIALIGDSKVVFLDEPTSGVDPFSRRAIWDLLTKKKEGRILVLTTHFMDEADQLGDRIGIMHHGKMKCCGTSLFLKSKFGVGYNMTLVKDPAHAKVDDVTALVRKRVPTATVLSSVGTELSYSLPFSASQAFPAMLEEIDARMPALGIVNYGLSVTTLESVFIKVAQEQEIGASSKDDPYVKGKESKERGGEDAFASAEQHREALGVDPNKAQSSWCRHFQALLLKRWHIQKRDKRALCCQFLVPLILLTLGLGILRIPPNFDFPTLELSPSNKAYNTPDRTAYNPGLDAAVLGGIHVPEDGFLEMFPAGGDGTGDDDLLNFSTALLDNRTLYKETRYGAFFGTALDARQPNATNWELSVMTNISAPHGLPTWANVGMQALLRNVSGDRNAKTTVNVHPFAWTPRQRTAIQSINGIVASIVVSLAFTFIPASFAVFVVSEREYKSKHLQMISGVSMSSYWAANYLWDFCSYVIPASISAVIIYAYQNPSLIANMDVLLANFLAYGLSIIPFTYLCSFLFSSHSTAQNVMIMVYILGGIIMTNTAVALLLVPSTKNIAKVYLRHFFRLIPSFCLGDAIFYISWLPFMDGLGKWDLLVTGYDLLYMLVEAVVYFALVLAVDKLSNIPSFVGLFKKDPDMIPPRPGQEEEAEDEDVAAERQRLQRSALPDEQAKFPSLTRAIETLGAENAISQISREDPESQRAENDLVRLEGLRKIYPGKNAVKDLYFGIPAGQCFGFLGVNGAGKTTTLKILTGDVTPSKGRAFIGGYDIAQYPVEVRRLMGYCPQFDALSENLTARETLQFYGKIRGIPEEQIGRMVAFLIDRLSLTEYADRPCGRYSGGNKRKLSVAIALIGNPAVVFLDEPSTGMDPVSRRFMWDFISETMANRAVILTTHSMEECEALCSRIGILVNGALKCVGPSQHLKSRFGRGFQVDISTAAKDSSAARAFLLQHFPDAEKLEDYGGNIKYKILHRGSRAMPDGSGRDWKLKDVFALVEAHKAAVHISEYSVSQTTLEQIFISFAKRGDHEEFGGKLEQEAAEEEKEQKELEEEGKMEWGAAAASSSNSGARDISSSRGRSAQFGDDEQGFAPIVTPSSFGYVPADVASHRGGINH